MKGIPILFICFAAFAVFTRIKSKQPGSIQSKEDEAYWKRENESNFIRKKDISQLDYITIPLELLPFGVSTNANIVDIENQIRDLEPKKIVNLSNMTNTDLKMEYGTANLNILSEYDQNALLLMRLLSRWGVLLYEEEHFSEAETVLKYGIEIGSDISDTFITLASIYAKKEDIGNINALLAKARELDTLMKDHIISSIQDILFHIQ